jgi:hypothetical protein
MLSPQPSVRQTFHWDENVLVQYGAVERSGVRHSNACGDVADAEGFTIAGIDTRADAVFRIVFVVTLVVLVSLSVDESLIQDTHCHSTAFSMEGNPSGRVLRMFIMCGRASSAVPSTTSSTVMPPMTYPAFCRLGHARVQTAPPILCPTSYDQT